MLLQNSLNLSESNCFPLSTVNVLGTSNLQIMFCQKNFFTVSKVIVASGLASIHLVKYSIATTANLFPLQRWQGSDKIHAPSLKRSSGCYELYCGQRLWLVWGCALACLSCLNNLLRIFDMHGPIESTSDCLRGQCPWDDVRTASPWMDFLEELSAFALSYTLEQWLDYPFLYKVPSISV